MKVLLDTSIIVHRETNDPTKEEIGKLFWWIDKLGYKKCVHQITVDEISLHQNLATRKAFLTKIESYDLLRTQAPLKNKVLAVAEEFDATENDKKDTILVNEVFSDRVDFLITEARAPSARDIKIHKKALELGIDSRVFSIDSFLEKVTAENPALVDYKIPSIKKELFGNINIKDRFFDSLKEDYVDFEKWFNGKAEEIAYVCSSEGNIIAFLYLKREDESESYTDISPIFAKEKRLKIGTFKVQLNEWKLGARTLAPYEWKLRERFLKIVFDNALNFSVHEIYATVCTHPHRVEHSRLIHLLKEYGFLYHGTKQSSSGKERVYSRNFSRQVSPNSPKTTYPFMSKSSRKFLVPIYPKYHTNLFPDSILRTESPLDFVENEPFRNAISKVYVSRSIRRDLRVGDVIIFYRTDGYYRSVVTTLGIVDGIYTSISNRQHFIDLCRQARALPSIFTDDELKEQWKYSPESDNRPFVVNFLHAYSFPKRINLERLIELGIIKDANSAPREFEEISNDSFEKIIKETSSDGRIIVG